MLGRFAKRVPFRTLALSSLFASYSVTAHAQEDPLSCKNPTCKSKLDMFKRATADYRSNANNKNNSVGDHVKDNIDTSSSGAESDANKNVTGEQSTKGHQSTSGSSSMTISTILSKVDEATEAIGSDEEACPLDKEELGRATWSVIHTVAAHYPEDPTPQDKEAARQFISSLSLLYPCPICAPDFRAHVLAHPPDVESRSAFIVWCCRLHNQVNDKLGKDMMPCEVGYLDERWRNGKRGCWDHQVEE